MKFNEPCDMFLLQSDSLWRDSLLDQRSSTYEPKLLSTSYLIEVPQRLLNSRDSLPALELAAARRVSILCCLCIDFLTESTEPRVEEVRCRVPGMPEQLTFDSQPRQDSSTHAQSEACR